ncbi:MAG: beta strand repeat-containing protein, partial [Gaiellaceae bacterium]
TSEIAIGGGLAYGGEIGVGASVAFNELDQHTRAIVEPLTVGQTTYDPSLKFGGKYTQTATDGFDVIAVGLSVGIGQSAIAATIAINIGTTSAEATVTDATIEADGGDVTIGAVDTSTIDSGVGAIALGVLKPSSDANSPSKSSSHLAIGISIAVNSIDQQVPVLVTDSDLTAAAGKVDVSASATGTIYSVGVAGGGTFRGSGSSTGGFQFAGAGVIMINAITGNVDAEVTNGSLTSGTGSPIELTAHDGTSIDADAGAAAILVDLGKSPDTTDIAIGAAVAVNNDSRTIQASTDGTTLDSGGAIDVQSTSSASIVTWALGIAGAVSSGGSSGFSFAGAGSGAGSTVTQNVKALISGGSVTADTGITVRAQDGSEIDTQAGGVAFTYAARGPPNAIAIGLSVAVNTITDNVTAEIDGASSVSATTLEIDAEVTSSKIDAWTIAGSGAVTTGGTGPGVTFSGAGAGSGNTISDTVLARLSNVPTVTLTDTTAASVTASDTSQIFAVAGSAALGIRYSGASGGNVTVGAAAAINSIDNSVKAQIDTVGDFETPGGLSLTATENAAVEAITIGVAGSLSGGSGGGVAFAGAGSGSSNTITTDTEATVTASSVTAAAGDVTVQATDTSAILAISGALGLSGKFGGGTSGSVAVGVSVAVNSVTPTVLAEITGSSVSAGGNILVQATSEDGDTPAAPFDTAGNGLAPGIHAYSLGGAVAVAAGSGSNGSGAVGGGFAFNTIGGSTIAEIDLIDAASDQAISAGGTLTVSATDSRTIDATTFAGAVAVSGGSSTSVGISIGLSIAQNTITDALAAEIVAANVTGATSVSVTATDSASITVTTSAAAVSVAVGSNGVAIGGGGAVALNELRGTTNAFVQASTLGTSDARVGAVTIRASASGSIEATVVAVSLSVAVGDDAGVGVAIGISVARNLIGWDPTGLPSTTYQSTDLPNTLNDGDTVTVVGGALDGQTFRYIGTDQTGKVIYLSRVDYSGSGWTDEGTGGSHTYTTDDTPATLANGDTVEVLDGANAGHVFEYTGVTTNTADRQIDLSTLSYDDATEFVQVGMTQSDAQVQAFSAGSSIASSGALTIEAAESSSIDALVLAVSVAVAGGGDLGVGVSAGGVFTQNKIANDVRAFVDGDGSDGIRVTSASITATDSAGIRVLAGAASVAAGLGGDAGVAVSIGLAIALNEVSGDVAAFIANTSAGFSTTTGDVSVTATESGLAVDDTAAGNPQLDLASYGVTGAELDALSVESTDRQQSDGSMATLRSALGHALGLVLLPGEQIAVSALDGSDPGVTPAVPGNSWEIVIAGGPTLVVTKVGTQLLVSQSTIDAVAFAASLAVGFGDVGVAVSGAGAVAFNDVTTQANAYIAGTIFTGAVTVDAGTSGCATDAADCATITRGDGGSFLDDGFETGQTVVLSGSGSDADGTYTIAAISSDGGTITLAQALSTGGSFADVTLTTPTGVTSAGDVSLQATSTAAITATVAAFSVAVAGGDVGVGVSIGLSIAQNRIGTTDTPAQIRASIRNASVSADGALSLTATSSETIGALVLAASAAVAGGEVGIAASGAGVSATNSILVETEATIEGSGAAGISATAISLSAHDTSTIQAMAGAATLAIGFGEAGVAISIGVSLAENDIASMVEASISNASDVTTTSGDLTLSAVEHSSIDAVTWAASLALSSGLGSLALSGAGASAYNDITTQTNAFVASSTVSSAGAVAITAADSSDIAAVVAAASAALSFGGVGGAASIGVALARNTIGFAPDPLATHDDTSDQTISSLANGTVVEVTSGPRAGDLYRYSGPTRTGLSFQNFGDSSLWHDDGAGTTATYTLASTPSTVANGQTVLSNGHVYEYVGSSDLQPVIDLSTMDYGNRALWTQVGLTSSPLEVQAYVSGSNVSAAGALTQLATSSQTIDAIVVAASVSVFVGAGGVAATGAGASTENHVYDQVRAYIDGTGSSDGISAASVLLNAADTSTITVFTGGIA